jgi:glutamine synthetase
MASEFNRSCEVLWPDHLGLARGKYVPAVVAEHGVRHCTGTWALGYDRGMTPETPGAHWNEGPTGLRRQYDDERHPSRLGANTKVVVASHLSDSASPLVHRRAARWNARSPTGARLGYDPLRGRGARGLRLRARRQRRVATPRHARRLRLRHRTRGRPARSDRRHLGGLRESEIPLESVNSEYDTPQFEFTLRYRDALRAADDDVPLQGLGA